MTNPGIARSGRPRVGRGALVLLTLLPVLAAFAPAADAGPVRSHELAAGARAEVDGDGVVWVRSPEGASDEILLKISTDLRASRTVRRAEDWVFTALRREGDEGGRRGFSARSDDDEDGRVDEDRLDGRDNDGDGRIDEDYAAIGDAMTAVGTLRGGRALFLETYHWDYPHLRETLVTSWRREGRDGEPQRDRVTLELPYGLWQEITVGWDAPRATAGEMMMVATLPRDGGRWWIGVTVLSRDGAGDDPPRVEGRRLELPCGEGLVCAVSVTTTLSQLRHRQATAHAVFAGAPAVPGQPAVPWIVPPLSQVDDDLELAATWRNERDTWRLSLDIPAGFATLIDPETLVSGTARPGVPTHVSWRGRDPETGVISGWVEGWPSADHGELWRVDASPHPYRAHLADLLSRAGGTLTFRYAGATLLDDETVLTCRSLCGQEVSVAVERAGGPRSAMNFPARETREVASGDDPGEDVFADDPHPPTLSPELLDNYPNPFPDQTRLRYTIPATVGEGFVWEEDREPTLKDSDPIPYQSGTPSVSLKIYTVAGHEVVTLFDGICAIGTYETAWDGNDRDGRPVAVGTYFCKLQIENWSVTKRVALLR